MRNIDLTGKTFGRWTVIKQGSNKDNRRAWDSVCECGSTGTLITRVLVKGQSKSCGCLHKENLTTHGQNTSTYTSPEYTSWHKLKQRCLNENDKRYHDYGGRGITISDEWLDFQNFYNDMGDKPTKEHTIDRIDNEGNYEVSNCKWSTKFEQSRNVRTSKANKTGTKGVSIDQARNKYLAQLMFEGKKVLFKRFDTMEEAVEARETAESKYWGTTDEVIS